MKSKKTNTTKKQQKIHPNIAKLIKPEYLKKAKIVNGIPNFLPKHLDENKEYQKDIWAGKTYKVDPKTHIFTTIQERFGNRLLRKTKLAGNSVAVDVGGFIGEKLWQLSHNKDYTGINLDIAIDSLVAAKEIDVFDHHFVAADLENLPFKDNSIDFLMVFDVIEHLTDQPKGFKEVARILKPGGTFLLHIPIKDNKYSFFWWKRKFFPEAAKQEYLDVGHHDDRMLTTDQIKKHLMQNNLKPKREIFYNSFFVHFVDREMAKLFGNLMVKFFNLRKLPESDEKRLKDTAKSGKVKVFNDEEVNENEVSLEDVVVRASIKQKESSVTANNQNSTQGAGLAQNKYRTIYGKYVLPVLEFLCWPDIILSKLKIGNTYFIFAKKSTTQKD